MHCMGSSFSPSFVAIQLPSVVADLSNLGHDEIPRLDTIIANYLNLLNCGAWLRWLDTDEYCSTCLIAHISNVLAFLTDEKTNKFHRNAELLLICWSSI